MAERRKRTTHEHKDRLRSRRSFVRYGARFEKKFRTRRYVLYFRMKEKEKEPKKRTNLNQQKKIECRPISLARAARVRENVFAHSFYFA